MPPSPDEKFESYLRGFRPVAGPHLRSPSSRREERFWRFVPLSGAAAVVLIAAGYLLRIGPERPKATPNAYSVEVPEVLTAGKANVLLTTARSFHSTLNAISFRYPETPFAQGKTSALAVLSKEKNKL